MGVFEWFGFGVFSKRCVTCLCVLLLWGVLCWCDVCCLDALLTLVARFRVLYVGFRVCVGFTCGWVWFCCCFDAWVIYRCSCVGLLVVWYLGFVLPLFSLGGLGLGLDCCVRFALHVWVVVI